MFLFYFSQNANLMVGFFYYMIQYYFNFFNTGNDMLKWLTYLLAVIPIYVFIQRVHNQTQQRSLKSIGDEISKVNDFLIEFIVKYQNVEFGKEFDEKTVTELKILKSKINAHLNYLTEYLNEFPYGGPVNFACFFLFGFYIFGEQKKVASLIELEYQDLVTDETILSLEQDFLDGITKKELDANINELNLKSIDFIINKGLKLQAHLETSSRKMF